MLEVPAVPVVRVEPSLPPRRILLLGDRGGRLVLVIDIMRTLSRCQGLFYERVISRKVFEPSELCQNYYAKEVGLDSEEHTR
jgi:hypothetical protein